MSLKLSESYNNIIIILISIIDLIELSITDVGILSIYILIKCGFNELNIFNLILVISFRLFININNLKDTCPTKLLLEILQLQSVHILYIHAPKSKSLSGFHILNHLSLNLVISVLIVILFFNLC